MPVKHLRPRVAYVCAAKLEGCLMLDPRRVQVSEGFLQPLRAAVHGVIVRQRDRVEEARLEDQRW